MKGIRRRRPAAPRGMLLNSQRKEKKHSQQVRIKTPVHTSSSVQAGRALRILRERTQEVYFPKLKQLLLYIIDTMDNALYYKAPPMSVCFEDVVKGIELNLDVNVGHIKNECLAYEEENAILLHDINMQK